MKNPNQPCDVRISFSGGQSVTIEKLSEQQQLQLSELLQASGVHYQWQAWLVRRSTIGGRLGALWRRFATWAMPLLLLGAMSLVAFAQRAVEPVRVSIQTDAREDGDRFDSLVRAELNKFRNVIVTERKPDFDVYLVAAELTEDGKSFGFACASLVVIEDGAGDRYRLSIYLAPTLERVTRLAIGAVNKEHFQKLRRK